MPIRKAGDLIREAFRGNTLATNRANPIGAGGNGVVYASDRPGYVMKELNVPDRTFRSLNPAALLTGGIGICCNSKGIGTGRTSPDSGIR